MHRQFVAATVFDILRRRIGSKLQKMVFSEHATAGRSTRTVEVPAADADIFSLTDQDVLELARTAVLIEKHYGRPMDLEWAKDGVTVMVPATVPDCSRI